MRGGSSHMTEAEILRHAKNAAVEACYGPHRINPCEKGTAQHQLWAQTFSAELARLLGKKPQNRAG
jgi:hypothetical protein